MSGNGGSGGNIGGRFGRDGMRFGLNGKEMEWNMVHDIQNNYKILTDYKYTKLHGVLRLIMYSIYRTHHLKAP